MRPNHIGLSLAIVFAALVIAGSQTYAVRSKAAARPTVCATVNLERLFEQLEERAREDAGLTRLAESMQAESDEQAAAIDALEEELGAYAEGSEKSRTTMNELSLAGLDFQAFAEFSRRKLDLQKSQVLRRIYQSIKSSTRTLAEEMGYDIVFVDDSIDQVPNGTEADVRRQISARRMLYANPEVDVTDELVQRMNAEFRLKNP